MQLPAMRRFSELNQARVGIIGILVVALAVLVAVNAGEIRTLLAGDRHTAHFAAAGGIRPGDDVRIAGVTVGEVTDVVLDRDRVEVSFTVDRVDGLGDRTTAAIRIESALGRKYLELVPGGEGDLAEAIPLERTRTPYDVTTALSDLTTTVDELDTDRLARALDTVASTFEDTPPELRDTLRGVGRLARTIGSRDRELQQLLGASRSVTGVLAERSAQITGVITDGNLLLRELQARRQAVHALLVNASAAASELSGLVRDNRRRLAPTLRDLRVVIGVLKDNQRNLAVVVRKLSGYGRSLGESVGGGPFFFAYVQNLAPTNTTPLPDLLGQAGDR